MQARRRLQRFFPRRGRFGRRLRLRVGRDAGERVERQIATVLQVTPRDRLALGVGRQPGAGLGDEFVNLVVSDPIVLVGVERGNENVEVA